MIASTEKLRVFISSKCGNDALSKKFKILRIGLKELIESTQIAEVYLFEDREASTISAERHYSYALKDCDVCVFLIDNKDDVPLGVQKEIDIANKYGIRSIYYFCAERQKKKTPLQKSLTGSQYALSKTVNSFEELLTRPTNALLDDLILVYKHYCKGRIDYVDTDKTLGASAPGIDNKFQINPPISKSVLSNIDSCKSYFHNLMFQRTPDVVDVSPLDTLCSNFLPVLFESKSILNFNVALLLKEVKTLYDSRDYYAVVEKRWEAVQAYFQGQTSACIDSLKEALSIAKSNSLPKWFIQDILIDLRNITNFHGESHNSYSFSGDAQKELDSIDSVQHYPLIDKFNASVYAKCFDEDIKNKIKSPHSVTFGNDLSLFTDLLASKFVVAAMNGSIAQMLMLYTQIRDLSFHLIARFSDWNFRLLMLKTTVINGNRKDVDGVVKRFDDILCKMNGADAKAVYDFSCCHPIEYRKFISNLEAFKVVGYFLNDEDYLAIWNDLKKQIYDWMNSDTPNIFVGERIFPALAGNIHRLDANEVAEICCHTMERGVSRFYDEMFRMLASPIDLSALSSVIVKRLLENIILYLSKVDDKSISNPLKNVLCALRKKDRNITESLDKAIEKYLPLFFSDVYLLETISDDSKEIPIFLQKYVDIVEERNSAQEKRGVSWDYMDNPFFTIRYLIENSKVPFVKDLLDSVFQVTVKSLLSTSSSISTKSSAMKLIVSLARKHEETIKDNKNLVKQLIDCREIVTMGMSALTNLNDASLRLSALFMYYYFGEEIWSSLIELLADMSNDEPSLIHSSMAVSHFLEQYTEAVFDFELITILAQYSVQWCREANADIRWNAINSLLSIVSDGRFSAVVCNQLVRALNTDNVYIKNRISWHIDEIKNIDRATYDYILQKASLDTNYVVRKRFSMLSDLEK